MGSVNLWIGIGNLGKDPIKRDAGGKSVANFSMACNEKWTGKDGAKHEKVEWVNIVAWDKLADICCQYLAKGRQAYVEGKLQTRKWQDKEGKDRWSTEVVARQVVFLGDGKGAGGQPAQAQAQTPAQQREPGCDDGPPPSDDDIAF